MVFQLLHISTTRSKFFSGYHTARLCFLSAGNGKDKSITQGNRKLQAIFFFLAIQMIQVSTHGTPRCPIFLEYYNRRVEAGKSEKQVLIYIARRFVNIVYGMLNNKTKWHVPEDYQAQSREK